MNTNDAEAIAKSKSNAVGLQAENVMDQLIAVSCAVTTQERLDSLHSAQIEVNELLERIQAGIKWAEAEKFAEEDKQLDEFAKTRGYEDFKALMAERNYVKVELPDDTQPEKKPTATNPYPKAPKVHEYLYKPDHANYTKGFTGSLRNLQGDWVNKMPDGKADMNYYRKSTDQEKAEMQRRRDEHIKCVDEMREVRKAKKQ